MGMKSICLVTALTAALAGGTAAAQDLVNSGGLTDGVELSGKWQPVIWGTPEHPKAQRLKNVSAAQLADLPGDITLDAGNALKFTFWQWGDCQLRFDLRGAARVKLMGVLDVVALGGRPGGGWMTYEVRFRAPRWKLPQLVSGAEMTLTVDGKRIDVAKEKLAVTPPEAGQVNSRGEQVGPLRLEAVDGQTAAIRELWVGPLVPGRDTSAIPWRNMFESGSFDGWSVNGGDASYRWEGDVIVGTTKAGSPNSFLITDRDYRNFEFSVEVHGDVEGNAGLQFRSHARGGRGRRNRTFGYQCEIDPSERAWTAGIYDEANRGWLHPLNYLPYRRVLIEKGKWHEFRIYADGPVIKTFLDGKPISQIFDALAPEGYFGLQVHGTKDPEPHEIRWRNARIRELD